MWWSWMMRCSMMVMMMMLVLVTYIFHFLCWYTYPSEKSVSSSHEILLNPSHVIRVWVYCLMVFQNKHPFETNIYSHFMVSSLDDDDDSIGWYRVHIGVHRFQQEEWCDHYYHHLLFTPWTLDTSSSPLLAIIMSFGDDGMRWMRIQLHQIM